MMTAEQMKGSILQLAMQGKLVEQRPEEGTGEELYKTIQAEKKKLIKKEKIKGVKNLNYISEDYPFDIPETWKWTRLGEIINFRMGKTPPRADAVYWGSDVPWVSIADMIDGKTIIETKESVTRKAIEERFNGQLSCKGTLIMSFKLTVGKVSILGIDAVHNEAIISILPYVDKDYAMRNYLKNMLPFLAVFGESKKAIMGFTLNSTSLNNIPVPLPPLAEQKRIVAKIEELMPFVEQYAAASTKLKTLNTTFPDMMKKSILQEAVQGKLVPQDPNDEPASVLLKKIAEEKKRLIKEGKIKKQKPLPAITEDEIPFDIPESWEWVRLSEISKQITDGEHNTPKRVNEFCGYYLLSARNVRDGEIKLDVVDYVDHSEYEKLSARCNPVKGDILISCSGSIGRCAVVNDENNYVMVRSAAMVSAIKCDPNYLMYAIQSECVQKQINTLKKQTAQANLFLGAISVLKIPLPPYLEQKRIVNRLNEVLSHTEKAFGMLVF